MDFGNRFVLLACTSNGQMLYDPLNVAAEAVLCDLQGRCANDIYFFPGRPERLMDVRKAWDEMRNKMAESVLKFKRCRLHDLRHTDASDLVVAGKSLEAVGRIIGHTESSGPTTTRRCVHLRPEHLLDAADAVQAVA